MKAGHRRLAADLSLAGRAHGRNLKFRKLPDASLSGGDRAAGDPERFGSNLGAPWPDKIAD